VNLYLKSKLLCDSWFLQSFECERKIQLGVDFAGENGSIDGQGAWWWQQHKLNKLKYTRGHLIELLWSSNIEISNVTLRNSPFWTVHPYDCTNVTIHGVAILAPLNAPNTDGIDPGIHSSPFLSNYLHH
jgi:polygalacturonase